MSRDSELVKRALDGDQGAWRTLVAGYTKVLRPVIGRLSHPSVVDDLLQEVFLILFRRLEHVAGLLREGDDTRLRNWLYNVAFFVSRTWRRSQARRAIKPLTHDPVDPAQTDPSAAAEQRQDAIRVKRAFDQLSDEDQEIISLRLESLSYEDIAKILEITSTAARKRYERAMARLRDLLSRP